MFVDNKWTEAASPPRRAAPRLKFSWRLCQKPPNA